MMSGGGGSSSSNAGGANDGARRRCIGRASRSLGASCAICAASGRERPPDPLVKLRGRPRVGAVHVPFSLVLLTWSSEVDELMRLVGPLRRVIGAPGQPQECSSWMTTGSEDGSLYAGRKMFPCVALQERMWKGESIEISKWRRFVGSFSSVFDRRITICHKLINGVLNNEQRTYLDPVVDLDILISSIKVQPMRLILPLHCMTTRELHTKFHLSWPNANIVRQITQ